MSEQDTQKRVITGNAGFAIMRLAKKSGIYEMYKEIAKKSQTGKAKDVEAVGIDMTIGIPERLVECEKEFWETAALLFGKTVEEVKELEFDDVLTAIVAEMMDEKMIGFFTKIQAASGK